MADEHIANPRPGSRRSGAKVKPIGTAANPNQPVYFGIACFNFGIRQTAPFKYKGSEYLEQVSKALGSVQAVDNIYVDSDEFFGSNSADVTKWLIDKPDVPPSSLPLLSGHFMIEFDVFIHKRVQAELCRPLWADDTGTERFQVTVMSGYYAPVGFIQPLDPIGFCKPSSAVMVVRELLDRELGSGSNQGIAFECLGPSPFHADFAVVPGDPNALESSSRRGWDCVVNNTQGYDAVIFRYDPSVFPDIETAQLSVYQSMLMDLGLFYDVTQSNFFAYREWSELERLVSKLVAIHREDGVKAWLRRQRLSSSQLRKAVVALAEYESAQLMETARIREAFRSQFDAAVHRDAGYFKHAVDTTIGERFSAPIAQTRELLRTFYDYRRQRAEGLYLILAAVFGGLAGAALTAYLSGHH